MPANVEGYYLDGKNAARQRAIVHLLPTGLQITTESGAILYWPFDQIRQAQHFEGSEKICLERGEDIPEVLMVAGEPFLRELALIAPETRGHFRQPASHRKRITFVLLSALALIVISATLYLWGIPAAASLIASHVPISWEERLGQAVVGHLAPTDKQCSDPIRAQKINEIIKTLTTPLSATPYRFQAIVVKEPSVNAFAAPGGYIVIFQGLLEQTQTAEELAGILAHEIQHILHRHSTRALLQHASTQILLTALIGDARGAMAYGLEGARILGTLRYSRQYEEEADTEAIRLLFHSGIDPRGMITFFEMVKKDSEKSVNIPAYLSTHPSLEGRIKRLKSLAERDPQPTTKLLPGYNWQDIREICQKG